MGDLTQPWECNPPSWVRLVLNSTSLTCLVVADNSHSSSSSSSSSRVPGREDLMEDSICSDDKFLSDQKLIATVIVSVILREDVIFIPLLVRIYGNKTLSFKK